MANKLEVVFAYDDRDHRKVIGTQNLLTKTSELVNSLGGGADFGKKLGSQFDELSKTVNRTLTDVNKLTGSVGDLGKSFNQPLAGRNLFTAAGADSARRSKRDFC
jgi:hypothetical protein